MTSETASPVEDSLTRDPRSTIPRAAYGADDSTEDPEEGPKAAGRERGYSRRVEVETGPSDKPEHDDRAASVVTRDDFSRRLPRSAPDALVFDDVWAVRTLQLRKDALPPLRNAEHYGLVADT